MKLKELVTRNRSYRRFYQGITVESKELNELVDMARLTASVGNTQPLKYILSSNAERNALIFPHLQWAGYLKDWSGPSEGERPSAYVIVLGDKTIRESFGCEHGIAAQTILLGAVERGLGGCIIGSFQREGLRDALNLSPRHEVLLIIALGKPKETVTIEQVGPDGDIKYWRDDEGVHHVPKRSLDELVLREWRS